MRIFSFIKRTPYRLTSERKSQRQKMKNILTISYLPYGTRKSLFGKKEDLDNKKKTCSFDVNFIISLNFSLNLRDRDHWGREYGSVQGGSIYIIFKNRRVQTLLIEGTEHAQQIYNIIFNAWKSS